MSERLAQSFSGVADEYERGRPGYPEQAIELLGRELRLGPGSTVADLGAGTGKLTRDLDPRFGRVIAIEPLARMRAELRRQLPEVAAIAGSAEDLPLPDSSVDAVLVAQAFHWFDGETALAEIARVLRPRAGLGLLWNSTPWEAREGPWFALLDDLLEGSRVDLQTARRHASGRWRDAFTGDRHFGPLSEASFAHTQRLERADFLAALASRSYVAVLEDRDRVPLLAEVDALLDRDDAPLEDEDVVIPLHTDVYWTRLRD